MLRIRSNSRPAETQSRSEIGSPGSLPTSKKKLIRRSGPQQQAHLTEFQKVERFPLSDVAEMLKVSIKTIRRLIVKHDIPVERVGSQIRIRADHLQLFLKKDW